MMFKRFNRTVLTAIAGLFLLVAAVNLVVDPLWTFATPRIPGVNEAKPRFSNYVRLGKAYIVGRIAPEVVVAGSSRTELAIAPGHPHNASRNWYNMALSGASLYEIKRYMDHAMAQGELREALVGLDFYMFSTRLAPKPGFDESILAPDVRPWDRAALAFSASMLKITVESLARQWRGTEYDPVSGHDNGRDESLIGEKGQRAAFLRVVRRVVSKLVPPEPRLFPEDTAETWDRYEQLLEAAHAGGVRMTIFLPPVHAWFLQPYRECGLWGRVEDWKRGMVRMNEAVAARLGREPFPIWDFTGYTALTTEAVPPVDEPDTRMRWFFEPSHCRSELGDLVQDRVYGMANPLLTDDFGVLLTPQTVEAHLVRDRERQEQWMRSHPEALADIRGLLRARAQAVQAD